MDQLGNTQSQLDVVVGGIYALEGTARDTLPQQVVAKRC
jgi:hypothetical protein